MSSWTRQLNVRRLPARHVDAKLLRCLWRLRLDYFALGLDRSPEQDWHEFSSYFQRDNRDVVVFLSGAEVVGFYVNSHDAVEIAGRTAVLISIEYAYMRPAHRGHPAWILSGFRMYFSLLCQHPLRPIYYVAFVFPNSFSFLTRSFGRIFTLQEEPPAFERQLLTWYGQMAGGAKWDAVRGVARYRNIPPQQPERNLRIPHINALYQRYDRINPTWRDGDAIVLLAPADTRALVSTVHRAARRVMRDVKSALLGR